MSSSSGVVIHPSAREDPPDREWSEPRADQQRDVRQHRPDEPVTVPVIFITGDHDPVQQVAGSSVEQMREIVPGLERVHVIPGPSHFVQIEAPDEVNRILLDFLSSLR